MMLRRIGGLIRKEFAQIARDRPLIVILVWAFTAAIYSAGQGRAAETTNVATAVFDLSRGPASREFLSHLQPPYFKIVRYLDRESEVTTSLDNGTAACQELGIEMGPTRLVVVGNTPAVHNLIVCTLCSCYPRMVLGLPPDWYKSRAYRSRAVREPRAVLAEFGTVIAPDVTVRVHDSTADMRYLVLPERPAGTEHWSEERLASLVTRDSMIGVTRCAVEDE